MAIQISSEFREASEQTGPATVGSHPFVRMTAPIVTVLLFALSFVLVWVAAIMADAHDDAIYLLPLGFTMAPLGVVLLYRAASLKPRALLALLVFTVIVL